MVLILSDHSQKFHEWDGMTTIEVFSLLLHEILSEKQLGGHIHTHLSISEILLLMSMNMLQVLNSKVLIVLLGLRFLDESMVE